MRTVTTNFGKIGGQRVITFDMDAKKDVVVPKGWAARGWDLEDMYMSGSKSKLITPHQAFCRWKIARKAWKSRRWKNQLPLPL